MHTEAPPRRQVQKNSERVGCLWGERRGGDRCHHQFGPGGPTPLPSLVLLQQVWELQQELTKREHTISESHAQVNQLQDQLNQSQKLLQRQKQLQEETQRKMELVQQVEQQTRVALESTQSRVRPAHSPPLPRTGPSP